MSSPSRNNYSTQGQFIYNTCAAKGRSLLSWRAAIYSLAKSHTLDGTSVHRHRDRPPLQTLRVSCWRISQSFEKSRASRMRRRVLANHYKRHRLGLGCYSPAHYIMQLLHFVPAVTLGPVAGKSTLIGTVFVTSKYKVSRIKP